MNKVNETVSEITSVSMMDPVKHYFRKRYFEASLYDIDAIRRNFNDPKNSPYGGLPETKLIVKLLTRLRIFRIFIGEL
jgi:hypothetical protein